jgi:hypothetical protein
MNLKLAIPAGVSCAVPKRWISQQSFAAASQKFTWPTVSGVDAVVTVAVMVITLPEGTVDTGLELVPEVIVSVVLVAVLVCAPAICQCPHPTERATAAASLTDPRTFYNGSASLGTSSLDTTGVATLTVQNLPIGTDLISANYAGDDNYLSVGSATTTINVAATSTYSLSASNTSLTIAQGQSGTATISLTPVGGFSAPVQFSCSGLPQYATCTFAPPSITPGGSAAKTTMTIATNVQTSELLWPSGLDYAAVLLLGLGAVRRFRHRIRRTSVPFCMLLIAAAVGSAVGCGGGNSGMSHVTPRGVSTVVVSASSGSNVQKVSVTVTIVQN